MKKLFLSMMALLCCATVGANNHPAPGKVGVTAEYLYFMPSIDDTYFVIKGPSQLAFAGKRMNNDFNYHSGYRISGIYAFCSCDRAVELDYTHLNTSQNRTIVGNPLWATIGKPDLVADFENYRGSASSKLSARYNRLDGIFSAGVFDCCNTDIFVLFGLEYAYLHLSEYYTYTNAVTSLIGNVKQASRAWGVGPELGVEFDYAIMDCNRCCPGTLSLIVKSTGSLLASQTSTTLFNSSVTAPALPNIMADITDEKSWRVIPAFHARIGLGYEMCICRYDASLEIGYEFNSYFRGFGRMALLDDTADALTVTNYYNYDLQGLYVSASMSF